MAKSQKKKSVKSFKPVEFTTQKESSGVFIGLVKVLSAFMFFGIVAAFLMNLAGKPLFKFEGGNSEKKQVAGGNLPGALSEVDAKSVFEKMKMERIEGFEADSVLSAKCLDLNESTLDFDWLEAHTKENKLRLGLNKLKSILGQNATLYEFCMVGESYYISYTPKPVGFMGIIKDAKAGSGEKSFALAQIDGLGVVKIFNNIETGITKVFGKKSFYFECRNIIGQTTEKDILVFCSGTEGLETTRGILKVNFEGDVIGYLNNCVNPHEDGRTSFEERDKSFSCYSTGMQKYYTGPLSMYD